jgi:hypothetical protein
MSQDTVDDLIKQLKQVRIEADEIRAQEARIRLREERIIQRLERAREQEAERTATRQGKIQVSSEPRAKFNIGDRVKIINKISVPSHRNSNVNDRRATVTSVKEDKIYIRTDNGYDTWRLSKNIVHLK